MFFERQEVDLYILPKISHLVIFVLSFSIDIGNASWENVHAAIFSVIVDCSPKDHLTNPALLQEETYTNFIYTG